MAFSSCFCPPPSLKVNCTGQPIRLQQHNDQNQRFASTIKSMSCKPFGLQGSMKTELYNDWSCLRGSRVVLAPKVSNLTRFRKDFRVHASWLTTTQLASSAFTVGTVTVLPFYTMMVLAPKAELTKKLMESNIPYVVLGVAYAYLLYLSWTPDTIRLMFASKYLLPELPGMARMFSNEMTLASAWLHLLAVDLFAARQVFQDGLENQIETRHSISFCLLFCPIGILIHVITKVLTKSFGSKQRMH